ncbi:MAG: F0F1 ATP synthase subunit A [Saprospiraceae bacterium]|nr:F0F1 ATP synthase subunit A [Saprospiraceae bacterium]
MALYIFLYFGIKSIWSNSIFWRCKCDRNLGFTMVLALIVFVVVNINGNKHYWQHIFNMPGIPGWIKVLITPIEILSVFIKPITLMLRLFANITAGHIVILIFISLIFIFGKAGANPGAAWGASIASVLLALFISAIELLVAFIQAYVFTLLTASYIGAATEEHHHAEEADHH